MRQQRRVVKSAVRAVKRVAQILLARISRDGAYFHSSIHMYVRMHNTYINTRLTVFMLDWLDGRQVVSNHRNPEEVKIHKLVDMYVRLYCMICFQVV